MVTDTITYKSNAPFVTKTDNDYDTYGRTLKVTAYKNAATNRQVVSDYLYSDPCGLLTKETITPNGQTPRFTRYEYKTNKRTIDKTYTSMLSGGEQCTQIVDSYDPRFNVPTKVTNGLYTDYYTENTYDAFGRLLTSKQMPNDITSSTTYNWEITAPSQVYNITTTQPGAPFQKSYYDRLGRIIKTATQNFSGTTIESTTEYDNMGRLKKTISPDAAAGTITTNYGYYDTSKYYKLNTVGDGYKTATYTYTYNNSGEIKTNVAVTNGTWKEQTTDATGKLIKAKDAGGDILYTYNSMGKATNINVNGVADVNTMQYDPITGMQTQLTDKNAGTTNYRYDNWQQLVYQKDNAGFEDTLTYDAIGRLIKKERKVKGAIPGEILEYTYHISDANGKEQLESVKADTKLKQQYVYDAWHRPIRYTEFIDDTAYVTKTAYKTDNSIDTITYPNNLKLNYVYSSLGYMQKVKMGGTTIYETTGTNAINMPTGFKLSNAKITGNIGYDALGTPNSYTAYKAAAPTPKIQDLTMVFNPVTGNIQKRTDNTKSPAQSDTFTYNNALDQLLTATNGGIIDTTAYSANGNINKRSGIGTYSYDAAKIHAVTNINYTCGAPHPKDSFLNKVYYTPFNQPDSIVEQNMRVGVSGNQYYSTYFTYGPDYLRTKMILKQGGAVKSTRYYVGNYEKLIDSAGTTRHLVYISGGNGLCAIASTIGSATTMYYVFTDHLGSILKMTDSLGNTVGEQSFDAWGRERNPKDWTKDTVTQPMGSPFESINSLYGYGNNAGFITRGYTGHESLPQFNLINMNGRLYDPTIGRMLSPDNFVADATNTQSYNRYTYVNNNPLNYTDPSGWLATAWQEGNGDESNNISSSRARSGGGGFVMGNMSGYSTMGWSSMFMQVSSQYGTLAAMNAYSSGFSAGAGMRFGSAFTAYQSDYHLVPYISNNRDKSSGLIGDEPYAPWDVEKYTIGSVTRYALNGNYWSGSIDWNTAEANNGVGILNSPAIKFARTTTKILLADDAVGGEADDILIPIIWAGAVAVTVEMSRIYVTYTLTNQKTGSMYVGRTSGFLPPRLLVNIRYWTHHMRLFGYSNPQPDKAARGPFGYDAIRGREQQLIDYFGGVDSPKVGNSIRGVAKLNPMGFKYWQASNQYFGTLSPFTGLIKF